MRASPDVRSTAQDKLLLTTLSCEDHHRHEMSVADPGPAGTNDPTGPIRLPKWWQAAVIAATSGALALPGYVLWQSVTTCGGGLECLLNLPVAGAFSVVVMPVTAWLVWKGCRIPRPFLLAVATVAMVWRGLLSNRVRLGVVALIPLLSLAGHAVGERVARQQHQDRLSAIGVTMYIPEISDRATPSDASAWGTLSPRPRATSRSPTATSQPTARTRRARS